MTPAERSMELFLRRLLLRSNLNLEEQAAILTMEYATVDVGIRRDFVLPGEAVDHVSLVSEGVAARFDLMRDGSRAIAELFVPGDMCDLSSLVAPRSGWGLTALSAVKVVQVSHLVLRELVRTRPEIGTAFWRDTSADAGILAKWVGNIGRKDAMARVAHLFCEMGMRMEATGLGTRYRYTLRLTQEQVGDSMGLTLVHVNRVLSALRKEGAASFHGHVLEVIDWKRLTSIAEFDESFLLLSRPENARLT